MTPAHQTHERRWRVGLLVAVVIVGVAIGVGVRGTPAPSSAAPSPSALVGAPDAESTAWYCTGQSTAGGVAPGTLVLSNTTSNTVTAAITATSDSGAYANTAVAVPAHSVVAPAESALSSGSWESETVTTSGGGLAVSQTVQNTLGWSQAPCQSTAASQWYFPGGSTAAANSLYVSLLNPTSTPVVVDLSFVTPAGVVHPINYQGIVLPAGQVAVENVTAEVQDVSTISTEVSTRTGRVIASEVQEIVDAGLTSGGIAIVPGAPTPQSHWFIPLAQETSGGTSEIDIFNPGTTSESVTVHLRLPSGPLAPLTDKILPGATWVIPTNQQTRIPDNEAYSTTLSATGGPGVVVSRTVSLTAGATPPPQAGTVLAVDGLSAGAATHEWVVPPPGTSTSPAAAGAAPAYLALLNTSSHSETYRVDVMTPAGTKALSSGTVAAGAVALVSGSGLTAAGFDPLLVDASGPLAVSEDTGPSAGVGVVAMPGLPLAAAIGP